MKSIVCLSMLLWLILPNEIGLAADLSVRKLRCDGFGREGDLSWKGIIHLHSKLIGPKSELDHLLLQSVHEQMRGWLGRINHRVYNSDLLGLAVQPDSLQMTVLKQQRVEYGRDLRIEMPQRFNLALPDYTGRALQLKTIRASDSAINYEYQAKVRGIVCQKSENRRFSADLPLALDPYLIFWASKNSQDSLESRCTAGLTLGMPDPRNYLDVWSPQAYLLDAGKEFVDCAKVLQGSVIRTQVILEPTYQLEKVPSSQRSIFKDLKFDPGPGRAILVVFSKGENKEDEALSQRYVDKIRKYAKTIRQTGISAFDLEIADAGTQSFLKSLTRLQVYFSNRKIEAIENADVLDIKISSITADVKSTPEVELLWADWKTAEQLDILSSKINKSSVVIDVGSALGKLPNNWPQCATGGVQPSQLFALLSSASYGSIAASAIRKWASLRSSPILLLTVGQEYGFDYLDLEEIFKWQSQLATVPAANNHHEGQLLAWLGSAIDFLLKPLTTLQRTPHFWILEQNLGQSK